jgi:hypothetical protein
LPCFDSVKTFGSDVIYALGLNLKITHGNKILDDAGDSHQPLANVRSGALFNLDWILLKDDLVHYSKYSSLEEDERRVVVGGCQIILFMEISFVVVVV